MRVDSSSRPPGRIRLPFTVTCLLLILTVFSFAQVFPSPSATLAPPSIQEKGTETDEPVPANTTPIDLEAGMARLDSLQYAGIIAWFGRGLVANWKLDSLQVSLARSLFRASGDSSILDIARASTRRLAAIDLSEQKQGKVSRTYADRLDSLAVIREVFDAHGLWRQVITTDVLSGEFCLVFEQRDYHRAIRFFMRALEEARSHGSLHYESQVLSSMARMFRILGRPELARDYSVRSLELAESIGDVTTTFRALLSITKLELELDHMEEAKRWYERLETFTRERMGKSHPPYDILGGYYFRTGDFEKAIEHFAAMQDWYRARGLKCAEASTSYLIGRAHEKLGNLREAERWYREIISETELTRCPPRWQAAQRLGVLFEERGNFEQAHDWYLAAIEAIEKCRLNLDTYELRLPFLESWFFPYERIIRLMSHRGRGDQFRFEFDALALEYCERMKMKGFVELRPRDRSESDEPIDEERLRRGDAVLRELDSRRRAFLTAKDDSVRVRILGEIDDLKFTLRETQFATGFFPGETFQNKRTSDAATLARVRETILEPGTAAIEYFVGEESTFAWFVSRDGVEMVELPHVSQMYHPVELYTELFTRDKPAGAMAERLYQDLVEPFEGRLENVRHLVIVPDGVLNYLSFETLPLPDGLFGLPAAAMIERFDISYAPSLSSLLYLTERSERTGKPARSICAVGDPVGGEPEGVFDRIRDLLSAPERNQDEALSQLGLGQLERIKKTGDEVRAIVGMFPESSWTLLVGEQANEAALKAEPLDSYDVIHFATHAICDNTTPELSGLLLSAAEDGEDGVFCIPEINRIHLHASMVVLSGCRTGGGKLIRGEGVVGLSRAFLLAGAASTVVSLWEVRDQATAAFMEEFYRNYTRGVGRVGALAMTKRSFIERGRPPSEWAPFILVGDFR